MEKQDKKLLEPYFWDTDFSKLDIIENRKTIIERLSKYGDMVAFLWLLKHYTPDQIIDVIKNSKSIDKKSATFWCVYFDIPKESVLCLNRQLIQPLFY